VRQLINKFIEVRREYVIKNKIHSFVYPERRSVRIGYSPALQEVIDTLNGTETLYDYDHEKGLLMAYTEVSTEAKNAIVNCTTSTKERARVRNWAKRSTIGIQDVLQKIFRDFQAYENNIDTQDELLFAKTIRSRIETLELLTPEQKEFIENHLISIPVDYNLERRFPGVTAIFKEDQDAPLEEISFYNIHKYQQLLALFKKGLYSNLTTAIVNKYSNESGLQPDRARIEQLYENKIFTLPYGWFQKIRKSIVKFYVDQAIEKILHTTLLIDSDNQGNNHKQLINLAKQAIRKHPVRLFLRNIRLFFVRYQ
jgi:hypothetical protein